MITSISKQGKRVLDNLLPSLSEIIKSDAERDRKLIQVKQWLKEKEFGEISNGFYSRMLLKDRKSKERITVKIRNHEYRADIQIEVTSIEDTLFGVEYSVGMDILFSATGKIVKG